MENFIPAAARRHAARVDLDGYNIPQAGDVILDGNIIDRDAPIAIVSGPPVLHRDPDYVEMPVRGSRRPARIYSDTVTAASPLGEGDDA